MLSLLFALVPTLFVGEAELPLGTGTSVPPASGGSLSVAWMPVASAPETSAPCLRVPPPPIQSRPDSTDLLSEARNAQRRFESTRIRLARQSNQTGIGSCDERVGRFCIRHPRDVPADELPPWDPPPEHPTVREAREDLLATLERIARSIPGDRWVSGQRVEYLSELELWDEALEVARECEATGWWCVALEGFALHGAGRIGEAQRTFDRMMSQFPDSKRREWSDPRPLVEVDLYRELGRLEGVALDEYRGRIWRLATPLFLTEGNAIWTEHLARHVLAEIRSDARNHHAIAWSRDLTELLVRYGREVAYERLREPMSHMGPPGVIAYYDRRSHTLMPTAFAVAEPGRSAPEDWRSDFRSGRSRHQPPTTPRIRGMDVQLARFQRGGEVLVTAAWNLHAPPGPTAEDSLRVARGELSPDSLPPAFPPERIESALFLLDAENLQASRHDASGSEASGTAKALAAPGDYLVSLETLDPDDRRGWRHRQGVALVANPPGVVALSDILLVSPESETPQTMGGRPARRPLEGLPSNEDEESAFMPSLDALLRRALPTTRLRPGPVEVVWEVYGLATGEEMLAFRLEATRSERGLLRRAGERLGILSSPSPVRLEWEEGIRDGVRPGEPYLRSVVLDLSALDPGSYRLTLLLETQGRTPALAERELELVLDSGPS